MKGSNIKSLLVVLILSLGSTTGFAQQIPMYASYTLNPYLVSPSFAGDVKSDVNARILAMTRMQFAGIDGAPVTYLAAADAPFRNQKMGLGGLVFSDSYGLISQTGASLGYAYHIDLNHETRLSFGLGGDLIQHGIDFDRVKASDPNENILNLESANKVTFNGSFGAHIRYKEFVFGFAAPQVYGTEMVQKDYISNTDVTYQFARHYLGIMSYRFDISDSKFALEPLLVMRASAATSPQFDINMMAHFYKRAFLSLGYRTDYSISIGGGVNVSDYITLAYSYDLPVNEIAGYTGGSHEFGLGFNLAKSKDNKALDKIAEQKEQDKKVQDQLNREIQSLKDEVERSRENQEMQVAEIQRLADVINGYSEELNEVKQQNELVLKKELEEEALIVLNGGAGALTQGENSNDETGSYYVVIASYKTQDLAIAHQQMLRRNGNTEPTFLKRSQSRTWFFVYKKSFKNVNEAKAYHGTLDQVVQDDIMAPWIYIDK